MVAKTKLIFVISAVCLVTACGGKAPDNQAERKTRISEERLKAALEKAFEEDGTLKLAKSFAGDVDGVGPVFIDGPNARSPFTMKSRSGNIRTGECRMSLSQDGHWYLVYVTVPDIQDASATRNDLIE